jgi:hypothetical protein
VSGSLEVRPDLVRAGISSYESAYAELDSAMQAARGGILGIDPAAVFGGDTPGQTFLTSYLEGGGPEVRLFGMAVPQGGGVVAELGTGGPFMTRSLEIVLAEEAANAAGMQAVGGSAPS